MFWPPQAPFARRDVCTVLLERVTRRVPGFCGHRCSEHTRAQDRAVPCECHVRAGEGLPDGTSPHKRCPRRRGTWGFEPLQAPVVHRQWRPPVDLVGISSDRDIRPLPVGLPALRTAPGEKGLLRSLPGFDSGRALWGA